MTTGPFTVWCNAQFPPSALTILEQAVKPPHRLVLSQRLEKSNLIGAGPDEEARSADIALGQPNPDDIIASPRLKWVHLTSAGYTRYDREDLRSALKARGGVMTNSSHVYDDPCAQHVLSFILAGVRQLPEALAHQFQRHWNYLPLRERARILGVDQTALIVGFGAIARRLVELLAPFRMNLIGLRRTPRGDEPIRVARMSELDDHLPQADHVVNLLPSGTDNELLFNADRFAQMKHSAIFYNVGRGDTVDQYALWTVLETKRIAGAFLDVTTPEPLLADSPLCSAPNCFITPHIAGGRQNEMESLVRHFVMNYQRYLRGEALQDRIV